MDTTIHSLYLSFIYGLLSFTTVMVIFLSPKLNLCIGQCCFYFTINKCFDQDVLHSVENQNTEKGLQSWQTSGGFWKHLFVERVEFFFFLGGGGEGRRGLSRFEKSYRTGYLIHKLVSRNDTSISTFNSIEATEGMEVQTKVTTVDTIVICKKNQLYLI